MNKKDRIIEVIIAVWFIFVFITYAKFYIIPKFTENLPKILNVFR